MELKYLITIYFALILVVFISLYKLRCNLVGSIIIALILGKIFLNLTRPPFSIDYEEEEENPFYWAYIAIQIVTPIIIYIYALYYASKCGCLC